jgi:hypothetical protein
MAQEIEDIEREVIDAGFPWGWEDAVPAWYTKKKMADNNGQLDFLDNERDDILRSSGFQPLCSGCIGKYEG